MKIPVSHLRYATLQLEGALGEGVEEAFQAPSLVSGVTGSVIDRRLLKDLRFPLSGLQTQLFWRLGGEQDYYQVVKWDPCSHGSLLLVIADRPETP